jgi:predicted phosphoribosyltransferase
MKRGFNRREAPRATLCTERAKLRRRTVISMPASDPIDGIRFRDRREAGRKLARALARYKNDPNAVVLAIPRGGVPVGYEVALELGLPLDIFSVRKLGVPGHEEYAMGAIGSGGATYMNAAVIRSLHISLEEIQHVVRTQQRELERREHLYRDSRPRPEIAGKTAILVDDGLATGASMYAAVEALRRRNPGRVVVAVPVAPRETIDGLEDGVDEIVCPYVPYPFTAVGAWYDDFSQTGDDEVRDLLRRAAERSL